MASQSFAQDEQLVAAQRGDAGAFAALVRWHQASVHGLALRMLNRFDRADDLAQDVFLRLFDHLSDIESTQHLGFWLRRVTANLAIDRLRQLPQHTSAVPVETLDSEAQADDSDPWLQRLLRSLIAELPPQPRAVMLLRYQEDFDPIDIAKALDMPLNTVKSHLKRSLDSLRARITQLDPVRREVTRHE